MSENTRKAVILFNLGGPDNLQAVKPFLFNLFYDPNIITLPNPFRYILAKIISIFRNKKAQHIYSLMGGKSTILEETDRQARFLEKYLSDCGQKAIKVFILMRHWHPMSEQVIKSVEDYDPSQIILLPLYPQFSTTTTKSSIDDFNLKLRSSKLYNVRTNIVCCYPDDQIFIEAHIKLLKDAIEGLDNYRILFSAHGLPEKIIERGDPYQWQIEHSVKKIVKSLEIADLDYKITYQSRVGPVKWLLPNTEDEILATAEAKKNIIIVPISFVSEHSETLVELDIEYKDLVKEFDVIYKRVKTLGIDELYIKSLGEIVKNQFGSNTSIASSDGIRKCPSNFSKCPCKI
ncbi:MAG: ferrochelatase [Rickettsiaceae bacterium]|nr:ferrochelatase [Rickettsiaceae bacterium]